MGEYSARTYRTTDDPGILALLNLQMLQDKTWPSVRVRQHGDLLGWLKETALLGRWIGMDSNNTILAHVGLVPVADGHKTDVWIKKLNCESSDVGEIGKLVVHPDHRREGISAIVTRCCVRQSVEMGLIPVASAFDSGKASIAMMTNIGWEIAGSVLGKRSNREVILLTPPQQLIEAAQANKEQLRSQARFSAQSIL